METRERDIAGTAHKGDAGPQNCNNGANSTAKIARRAYILVCIWSWVDSAGRGGLLYKYPF